MIKILSDSGCDVEKDLAAKCTDGSVPEPHTGKREGRPIAVVFDPK